VLRPAAENSFAAFEEALAQGCDGFEFDIRATADRRLVIVHDAKFGGFTIAKTIHSQLADLPEPAEVLQKYGARAFLDIELKVSGLEPALLRLLRERPPARGYVISSFLPSVVLELRARRGGLPLGIICDKASQLRRGSELPVDYIILEQSLVSENLVQKIHDAERKLLVWTVNKPDAMRRFRDWGADGIISDDPALLVQTLSPEKMKSEMPPAKKARPVSAKTLAK
jgi:glycerophosphoryl diester phosphodiesterase